MLKDAKAYIFEENINIIYMPILMNKFYYFTLDYYSIYTSESDDKSQILSASLLITTYIIIFDGIVSLIKRSIPDKNEHEEYNYYKILYIIQIVFSLIPSLAVVFFIIIGLCQSTGLIPLIEYGCSCEKCSENFSLHKFLFWLFSCLICYGGCWIRMTSFTEYKYECCDIGECCNVNDDYYNYYYSDGIIFCDCCCCEEKSCCFSKCCKNNCQVWVCCSRYNEDIMNKINNYLKNN